MCMPFAPNLPYMYFFYGIMAGLGFSLVYIPSFILSGLFHDKHRSLATGIVSAGAGLGSTLFPNIFQQLIDLYGWRGSLIIVAGVNLHLFVFVALMRPAPERDADRSDITRDRIIKELNDDPDDRSFPVCQNKSLAKANTLDTSRQKVIEHTKSIEPFQEDELTLGIDSNNTATNDVFEEVRLSSATCNGRKQVHRLTFKQHLKLICTFDFVVYIISNIGWNAGGGILLIFLPTYMTHIGLSEEQASLAFSLFGALRCFGCVVGGLLGSCTCCDRMYLYILSNVTAGLVTLAYNLSALNSLVSQICLIASFGFFIDITLSLQVSLTCDFVSTDALSFGFGVLMLSNGVGMLTGPPFGGALIDYMDSQLVGITLSGFCTIFGGLVMVVVLICRNKCRRKRREQTLA